MPQQGAGAPTKLTICTVSDANYSAGLRVTVFSALERLQESVRVVVVDAGLRDPTGWKQAIDAHPRCGRCDVVTADLALFEGYPGLASLPGATWVRLVLPDLLPDIDRLIYLDSDVLVRADLGLLWNVNTNGAAVAAVRDFFHPTFATVLPHAVSALGIPPDTPYYNCGVLILDLGAWRRDALSRRAIEYVRDHGTTIRFHDQDTLNAVSAGRVFELDPSWNVQVGAITTPSVVAHNAKHGLPVDARALRRDARIVHFTGFKPWQPEGIRASPWSVAIHLEFARITVRFTDHPRPHQLAIALRWSVLLLRRCAHAVRQRLQRLPRRLVG